MRVLFGDQVPRNGGLLRQKVAQAHPAIDEVLYLRQDADTPWRETGQTQVKLTPRWADYWALGVRFPLTLSIPGVDMAPQRQSLRLPAGLTHLAGPRTSRTIWGDPQTEYDQAMYQSECDWARQLCDYAGVTPGPMTPYGDLVDDSSIGLVSFFRDDKPRLLHEVPSEYFWEIEPATRLRQKWDGQFRADRIYVPNGRLLPLEISVRGLWIGCTSLGYLTSSLQLRDQYLEGQTVSLCVVTFDWQLPFDPVAAMFDTYVNRRRQAGKSVVAWPEADVAKIMDYWRQRPTTVSHAAIGGDLRPKLNFHQL